MVSSILLAERLVLNGTSRPGVNTGKFKNRRQDE